MEFEHVVCVICGEKSDEKTVRFTATTLDKSRSILKIRKDNNFKYKDIYLPEEINANSVYHVKCHKNFLAVMKKYRTSELSTLNLPASSSETSTKNVKTVAIAPPIATEESPATTGEVSVSKTSNDDRLCVFCNKKYKRVKRRYQPLHSSKRTSLMQVLKRFGEDNELYKKVSADSSPLICYHNSCRTNAIYTLQEKVKIKTPQKKTWKYFHKLAFDEMKIFINEEIINKKGTFSFSYICKYYFELLQGKLEEYDEDVDVSFSLQRFEAKLLQSFDEIKIIKRDKKKYVTLNNSVVDAKICEPLEDADLLKKAASIIRRTILKMTKKELPEHITTADLLNGECEVPQLIFDFYSFLLGGHKRRRRISEGCIRKTNSLAEDLIYNVTNGFIKTKKHITLGMTLKSLTSSRKIVEIINKYGHCCSYHVIEKLETAATTTLLNRSTICPNEICKREDLFTGVAFDTFDRYVDTATGKDTLHDTIGIIYQTTSTKGNSEQLQNHSEDECTDEPSVHTGNKRKRTFDAIDDE